MNQEHGLEEASEPSPAAHQSEDLCCGGVDKRNKVVAFKFGGSSLLGA